jgi:anti-sigma B factor antagonist
MMPSSDPHFRLEVVDGVTIVHFMGPKITVDVREPLYRLVEQEGHQRLLLNFENVRFLSSAPLGVLINLETKVEAISGRLTLCCLNPDLLELFRITKLDQILAIYDRQEDALRAF